MCVTFLNPDLNKATIKLPSQSVVGCWLDVWDSRVSLLEGVIMTAHMLRLGERRLQPPEACV